LESIIRRLARKPIPIGHSFGGLLAEILACRWLAHTAVAIAPAPFRAVLPLPFSALKSSLPVLGNPVYRNRAVRLSDQFRYAFANALSEQEAKELYEAFASNAPFSGCDSQPKSTDRGAGRSVTTRISSLQSVAAGS
jgi:non-heme chloroperoxidase